MMTMPSSRWVIGRLASNGDAAVDADSWSNTTTSRDPSASGPNTPLRRRANDG